MEKYMLLFMYFIDMYKQCCIFPPFFTRDVARDCGVKLTVDEPLGDIVTVRRHMFDKCEFWVCMLTKYDLFERDDIVDDKKYFQHLDRWVDLNQHFAEVMKKAKYHCKQTYRLDLPLKRCEFYHFQQCLRNFIALHCPTQAVVPTKQCEDLKKFFEECGEYYL